MTISSVIISQIIMYTHAFGRMTSYLQYQEHPRTAEKLPFTLWFKLVNVGLEEVQFTEKKGLGSDFYSCFMWKCIIDSILF